MPCSRELGGATRVLAHQRQMRQHYIHPAEDRVVMEIVAYDLSGAHHVPVQVATYP